jgi:hypothetical protein
MEDGRSQMARTRWYGVQTRALKQAVRRNLDRFPADFMFELDDEERVAMVSQNMIPGLSDPSDE